MKTTNRIAFILAAVAMGIFMTFTETISRTTQKTDGALNKSIEQEMAGAFHQPFKTCRSQKHLHILSMLEENIYPAHFIVSADSIESLIHPVKGGKNIQKNFILNVILFALSENSDKQKACTALQTAATIALYHMREPETALRLYKIGEQKLCSSAKDSLAVVQNFIKTDSQILRLLNENYVQKDAGGKKEYIELLEHELHVHPNAKLKDEAMKRIGDVAFLLHDDHTLLKYYQAIAKNPHFAFSPTVLFRIKMAKNIILRKRLWIVCGLGYFIALLVLVIRLVRGNGFDLQFFIKRTLIFLLAYIILAFVIITIDNKFAPGVLLKWLDVEGITLNRPILPLGLMSMLPRSLLIKIFAIGFISVLYALILASFHRSFSKILMLFAIIMIMSASWLHFSLGNVFDAGMKANGFYTGMHFYFRGKLDDLVEQNPKALLKAVEDAPKEDRDKVKQMILDHQKKVKDGILKTE